MPRPTVPASRFVPALVALTLLAGCANTSSDPFARPAGPGDERIQVRVENQNFADATVYAYRGGERIRLGQVTGKSEQRFGLRWDFSLPLQFRVDLVGGGSCGIRPLTVDPGDRVWVRIPVQMQATPCMSGKS